MVRQQLLEGAIRAAEIDSSSSTVDSIVTSVNEIGLNSYELSVDSALLMMQFVNMTLSSSIATLGLENLISDGTVLPTSTMQKLLTTVDIVASVLADEAQSIRSGHFSGEDLSGNKTESLSKGTTDNVLALLQVLHTFTTAYSANLVAGQYPTDFVLSTFKMRIGQYEVQSLNTTTSVCNETLEINIPQSMKEKLLGYPVNSMAVPVCKANMSTLMFAGSTISSKLLADDDFEGDPASLQLSTLPCDDITSCTSRLVLSRNSKSEISQGTQNLTFINFDCFTGEKGIVKSASCPDGQQVSITCNGKERSFGGVCPASRDVPSCSMLSNAPTGSVCKPVGFDNDTVTCECSLLPLLILSNERRLLSSSTQNETIPIPVGTVSINYVAMLSVISDTFVSTVLSADDLNGNLVKNSWQSLVVVGCLASFVMGFMAYGHYLDKEQIKEIEALKKADRSVLLKKSKNVSSRLSLLRTSFLTVATNPSRNKLGMSTDRNEGSMSFMKIIEEALPQVLSSKSFVSKYKEELKRHHRWIGVVFHFTRKFPRSLRVLALASNIITMLFIQSLTYNLMQGDDGSCGLLKSEEACLEPSSSFSTGSSMCYWVPAGDDDTVSGPGSCLYVEPDSDLSVIIFVAIFSAVVSTPIAFTIDWAIQHVLCAPIGAFGRKVTAAITPEPASDIKKLTEISPAGSASPNNLISKKLLSQAIAPDGTKKVVESLFMQTARLEFEKLLIALKDYRESLQDKKEFDGKLKSLNVKIADIWN
jgi:hypothetical protein